MKKAALILVLFSLGLWAGTRSFSLENSRVKLELVFENGQLLRETLWDKASGFSMSTRGGFAIDVMWTGWRAPGKANNSENLVLFTDRDFVLKGSERQNEGNAEKLILRFRARERRNPIKLVLEYSLGKGEFFVRRRLGVYDPKFGLHFLRRILVYRAELNSQFSPVKNGGYGQPVAVRSARAGAFWGLEYPAGENHLNGKSLILYHFVGEKITGNTIWSEPAVFGITPDQRVKYWFFRYLDRIRVAPLRPYLLYNTWYDLRAPVMVKSPLNVLNEKNLRRIIGLFEKNMTRPYGITLDAFVIDDGWDDYRSDWRLSRERFPHGLKPIADLLARTGTKLGIWFGPIGGYSHREWRVSWMKAHGYEVVGDELCLGGKHYGELFKKRVLEFVEKYGVGYYKWDGFQFSCSEPDHGHPVGIYSRQAILGRLIEIARAVSAKNPEIFLNITSGTWLSPWWLLYANTIWMQGYDYGYSGVPSISRRDRAMTYRDYVLYDDLRRQDFWFPVANLMTHGIIKGHLQRLGGESEPIDKFAHNAVLYFARGISMYELYISPDLLTGQEWRAIADSVKWAKDRFKVLTNYTVMVGGDPGKGQAYGYVHFKGRRGIIALRNPVMEPQRLRVKLSPALGLAKGAKELVLERVYPHRWVSPVLYSAGDEVEFSLSGYETAVYEIYPLRDAGIPLVAGAEFSLKKLGKSKVEVEIYGGKARPVILNPWVVSSVKYRGKKIKISEIPAPEGKSAEVSYRLRKGENYRIELLLGDRTSGGTLAILVKGNGASLPSLSFLQNGKEVKPEVELQKNSWAWYKLPLKKARHEIVVKKEGEGEMIPWLIYRERLAPVRLIIKTRHPVNLRPMPPSPYPPGIFVRKVRLLKK